MHLTYALKNKLKKFIYFSISGLLINAAGFTTFFISVKIFENSPTLTVSLTSPCFILVLYFCQRKYIFIPTRTSGKTLPLYFLLHFFNYSSHLVLIYLFCDILMFEPLMSQLTIMAFLGFVSFFLTKMLFEYK